MTVIQGLCALAENAALGGDDRLAALARDASAFLITDGATLRAAAELSETVRRKKAVDADRKRLARQLRMSTDVHGRPRISEPSTDGSLLPVPSPTPPSLTPPLSDDTPTPRAREAAGPSVVRDVDAEYAAQVEQTTAEVTKQCPAECWPALDAFLRRRAYATWHGWLKAFLQGALSTTWPDVAAVCTDDSALDRPIGTPKGFRVFLASAKRDRVAPAEPTASPTPRGNKLEIGRANIESAINRRERERAAGGGNHGE